MSVFLRSEKRRARKKSEPVVLRTARWAAALFVIVYLAFSLTAPGRAGAVGRDVHDALTGFLGAAAYLLPLWAAYVAAARWQSGEAKGLLTAGAGGTLLVIGFASLCGVARPEWGGWLGAGLARVSSGALGRFGTVAAALAASLVGAQVLFHVAWGKVLAALLDHAREDVSSWRRGREELKRLAAEAAGRERESAKRKEPRIAPVPEPAKSAEPPPVRPEPVKRAEPKPDAGLPPIVDAPKPVAAPKKKPADAAKPAAGEAPFVLPALDLLAPKRPG
ncbi:MAG: DNA translocase FtsK 4TM domain-containing protein, partial [Elusimicrobia bacterium]|nr:DNA translocase FtsK 4TM domain-containing protein [Elusimicrobiota bacterium]